MHSHSWCQRLLTPLPDHMLSAAVMATDPLWEKVETALVKLGSLAQNEVDLDGVMDACLTLLESKTKDMRVVAQLLRCLQHQAKAASYFTALELLNGWLEHYWQTAWPANPAHKVKLMLQIVRRFESVLPRVVHGASVTELEQIQQRVQRVDACWRDQSSEQANLLDDLVQSCIRARQRQPSQRPPQQRKSTDLSASVPQSPTACTGSEDTTLMDINTADDRGWRQTQLALAALLIARQPEAPIGYRLRRHAIWSGITLPPMASHDKKTPLAAFLADRADEYQAALRQADGVLWERIEQSLILSPYWFDGHSLSASIAFRLGYVTVANAIAEELAAFLQRLPEMCELRFSDGTPFLSEKSMQWLQSSQTAPGGGERQDDLAQDVARCREENGIGAALALLNTQMRRLKEPRECFYAELVLAEVLAKEGMKALAAQHYQHLCQQSQQLGLMQWEPGLVSRVERLAASHKK